MFFVQLHCLNKVQKVTVLYTVSILLYTFTENRKTKCGCNTSTASQLIFRQASCITSCQKKASDIWTKTKGPYQNCCLPTPNYWFKYYHSKG